MGNKIALVTGGTGFIGSYVCRRLAQAGYDVIAYDQHVDGPILDSLSWPSGMAKPEKVRGTLQELDKIGRLIASRRPELIVHLASPLIEDVEAEPHSGLAAIVDGTTGIFEAALKAGVPKVIWASTLAVFGQHLGDALTPMPDDAAHRPSTLYGGAKSLCELASLRYRTRGLDAVGLRFTFVYGPGRVRGRSAYPGHMIRAAVEGQPVTVPFSDQVINWQYVEDLARLVAIIADHDKPSRQAAYNVNGEARLMSEAADLIERRLPGAIVARESGRDPKYDLTPMMLDDSRLRSEFNWQPMPFEAAVDEVMDRYAALFSCR